MISCVSSFLGLLVPKAYAKTFSEYWADYCFRTGLPCGSGDSLVIEIAWNIVRVVNELIGYVAVAAIVYGGFRLTLSSVNEEGKEQAKKIILYAVIGLVVFILMERLINFVGNTASDFTQQ